MRLSALDVFRGAPPRPEYGPDPSTTDASEPLAAAPFPYHSFTQKSRIFAEILFPKTPLQRTADAIFRFIRFPFCKNG
jgi:hypothetical protein